MTKQTDDPRVTAYVFGELTNEELATFEEELAASTSLQAEVDATRETLSAIEQSFAAEPVAEMTDAERDSISTSTKVELAQKGEPPAMKAKRKTPWGILAVAALLLVGVGIAVPIINMANTKSYSKAIRDYNLDDGSFSAASGSSDDARVSSISGGYKTAESVESSADYEGVHDGRYDGVANQIGSTGRTTFRSFPATTPSNLSQPEPNSDEKDAEFSRKYSKRAMERSGGGKLGGDKSASSSLSQNWEGGERSRQGEQGQGDAKGDDGAARPTNESVARSNASGGDKSQPDAPKSSVQQSAAKSRGESGDGQAAGDGESGEPHPFSDPGKQPIKGEKIAKLSADIKEGKRREQREKQNARQPAASESKPNDLTATIGKVAGSGLQGRGSRTPEKKGIADESKLTLATKLEAERAKFNERRQNFTPTTGEGRGPGQGGDRYALINDNPFKAVTADPLSTFSIDVDTASYSKVRMYLMQQNRFPRPDAVRIEELVNYFDYDYTPPGDQDEHPFSAAMQVAECPWNPKHRLARVGIKGKVIEDDRPFSNLVFLLDVSGSMNRANKMPLMIEGMKMLVNELTENDQVAIVVYAGAAGVVLDTTTGDRKKKILEALERLRAGGSTNGGQGIKLAYQLAQDHFIQGGTNRVILCSDGDFNVGVTGTDELVRLAEENAKSKIFLSVLGFGMGNHNDDMMEKISNKGNGNYAFIDTEAEAHKVLVEQMGGTLVTIAKDVKIQIEFNPHEVASYRLIGYENRILATEDFNDDTKDAGEIGAGHTVTALYELVPANAKNEAGVAPIDPLKYQKADKPTKAAKSGELLTLKLRYKQPEGDTSTLMTYTIKDDGRRFGEADKDFRFAAAVASFGMLLRQSPHKGDTNFGSVEEIATEAATGDKHGYRTEFVEMVKRAKQLSGQ